MQDIVKKQIDIEYRFEQIKDLELNPEMSMEDAFGPYEDWVLEVGKIQYWLSPLNGGWYYLDPVHDSWEYSGYKAGEVTFMASEEVQPVKMYMTPISGQRQAGEDFGDDKQVDKVICPSCNKELKEGCRFCTFCGTSL